MTPPAKSPVAGEVVRVSWRPALLDAVSRSRTINSVSVITRPWVSGELSRTPLLKHHKPAPRSRPYEGSCLLACWLRPEGGHRVQLIRGGGIGFSDNPAKLMAKGRATGRQFLAVQRRIPASVDQLLRAEVINSILPQHQGGDRGNPPIILSGRGGRNSNLVDRTCSQERQMRYQSRRWNIRGRRKGLCRRIRKIATKNFRS